MSGLVSEPRDLIREHQGLYDFPPTRSTAVFSQEAKGKQARPKNLVFTWLSRNGLLLMAITFTIFALVLVLIWHFNTKAIGFSLIIRNHYSWTYGPTAVMVIIVAIWRQIDHQCKVAIPWSVLHEGSGLAKHTLLLDYISPIQITSFLRSLKNGHFVVTISIAGFIFLKLITLFSTGLLVEETVELPKESIGLQGSTIFNGSRYNETEYVTKTDASLVYTAYGIMARHLVGKIGTTDNLVYNDFEIPADRLVNTRITAEVDAVVPQFNCEPAAVSINPLPYGDNGSQVGDTISILSPSCVLMGGAQPIFVLDARSEICPQRQLRGVMQRVNCSVDADEDPFPNHQLLTLVEVVYNQTLNTSSGLEADSSEISPEILSFSVGIKQTRSLICQPAYQMGKVNVTKDLTQEQPMVTVSDVILSDERLSSFRDEDLASMFTSALLDAANMFGDLSDSTAAEEFPSTMFGLMAAGVGGRYENLFDQENIRTAAEKTFAHVAVQIICKNILSASDKSQNGVLVSVENRLFINHVSLWIMVAGFLLMTVASLLVLHQQRSCCRTNIPKLIQDIANITLESQKLQDIVLRVSTFTDDEVAQKLGLYHFFSHNASQGNNQLKLYIAAEPRNSTDPPDSKADDLPTSTSIWWKPFMIRPPMMICNLLLPLALIGVLEVLQRKSNSNQGFCTISNPNQTINAVFIRFIPALVMLVVATSYNAVDFNILVLSPYNAMRHRAVPAERSVESSLINKFPPVALWCAVKQRQYASVFSSSAAIIGSILTVIVSGLYTIEPTPSVGAILVQTTDSFNTTWSNSATNDSSAAVLASLTESLNLSYPQSTYDELALPAFVLSNGTVTDSDSDLQLIYPALRASLNCSVVDKTAFNVSASYNPRLESSSATVEVMFPLPPSCPFGGPGGNLTYIDVAHRVGFVENATYIGKLLDLHVGPYDAIRGTSFGESDPFAQKDNPLPCPSLAFIYGYVDIDNPTETSVSTLLCYQQIQRLQANVTFEGPSMSISLSKPPIPDEGSINLVASSPEGYTTFSYRIQMHMEQSLSMFNQAKYASANLADSPVDGFFQGVLFGKKPLPESALVGEENRQEIMDGINGFYRRYMAQAISSNMRVPVDTRAATPASTTFSGVMTNASQTRRLVQHIGPKIALQVLLGTMALFGALAWWFTQLHDLVPYNPCTIFGVMSLVAGGRMCDRDMQVNQNDSAEARRPMYRLQWWDDGKNLVDDRQSCDEVEPARSTQAVRNRRRYGIDVVENVD